MNKTIQLKIQENVSLAPLTTFKIGGRARYFLNAQTPEELIEAVAWAKEKNLSHKVFAGGSNVLFPDEDLDCLVIQILGGQITKVDNRLTVDAGVALASFIKKSISFGLGGVEKLAGIYGTVGGAIVGNAGAYGHSTSDTIEKVEIWDGQKRRWLAKKECQFDYRHSLFKEKDYLILRAVFNLKPTDPKKLENNRQQILLKRKSKFPKEPVCPGCFFKNILVKNLDPKTLSLIDQSKIIGGKITAGYLLEAVRAKGMKVGDIQVANFHANFLINKGRGKAAEVKKLAQLLKEKVKKRFGIELEEEVRII